jgi:hypothetical protein
MMLFFDDGANCASRKYGKQPQIAGENPRIQKEVLKFLPESERLEK